MDVPQPPCHFPDSFFHPLKRLVRLLFKRKKKEEIKNPPSLIFGAFPVSFLVKKKKRNNSLNAPSCNYMKTEKGLYYTVKRGIGLGPRQRVKIDIERLKEIRVRRQGYCLCMCELSIMSVEKGIKLKK